MRDGVLVENKLRKNETSWLVNLMIKKQVYSIAESVKLPYETERVANLRTYSQLSTIGATELTNQGV